MKSNTLHGHTTVSLLHKTLARLLFPFAFVTSVGGALFMIERGMPLVWVTMGIPVALLLLVAVMERLMPFSTDWTKSKGDVGADVSCVVLIVGGLESAIGALYPAVVATVYVYADAAGLLKSAFPSGWPLLLQAILLLLLADLAKYWFHRFSHETDLGWRLHSVHHAVKRVYWLNGFRIHPLYHLINFIIAVLPWVCLGASAEVVALYTVMLAASAAFQHANIDLKNGWLNRVFNTNELHRWHHSRRLDEANANYGAVTLVWDLLFGTYRRQATGAPAEVGMVAEHGYPVHSYWRQLLVPFVDPSRFKANSN